MDISVGKAIRGINKEGIKPAYFLRGDDSYLQKFFTTYLKEKFDNSIKVKYIDLSDAADLDLFFNDLSSVSLFSNKNIFSIRNFSRLSQNSKKYLIKYFDKPSNDNVLLFVLDDYALKNKFSKELHSKCIQIDTNTPFFTNKIKDWTTYFMKKNNIKLDYYIVDDLINSYGDNISNVINEIEKLSLITNKREIEVDDYKSTYKNRNIKNWNLMNAMGNKNLQESIYIFDSLIVNGTSLIPIVSSLFVFFLSLHKNEPRSNDYRINKTISSRINTYVKNYTKSEIVNIIIELRNIDVILKSSSVDSKLLFHPFIIKVCKGYYESK